ncbi:MAG: hypothetical protein GNW80_13740 [Asgard group archaeon]|nr:hypothetical protein [Asgard group archaeon]
MKFHKFEAQTTNKIYKIKPIEFFNNTIYKRLDFFLGFVKKNNEKIFKDYVNQLIVDFQTLSEYSTVGDYLIRNLANYKNISSNMKLSQLHGDLLRQILGISMEQTNSDNEIEVPSRIYWRAIVLTKIYQLESLVKTIGRAKAIDLFKQYLDQYYVHVKSTFKYYETLDELYKEHLEDSKTSTNNEFAVTSSSVENGMYIIRNDNCPAVEALDDFEDKELIYVVICYPDFKWAEMTNEHFVMTRKYTVAEGDPYCDKVLHDSRIVKELKHPTKEFIDSMGPILKRNEK